MDNFFLLIKDKKEFFDLLNEWEDSKKPIKQVENKESNEIYLSQRETAKFLRISLPTLISWKKSGKVPYYQKGRKVLFKKSEVLEAMRNSTT
jgi:excisionase family DNA binding protein